jgi:hypothetical protein
MPKLREVKHLVHAEQRRSRLRWMGHKHPVQPNCEWTPGLVEWLMVYVIPPLRHPKLS